MKLWMTRDEDKTCADQTRLPDYIYFYRSDPTEHGYGGFAGRALASLNLADFKSLIGLPLPRKGSKKLVNVEMTIAPVKKGKK